MSQPLQVQENAHRFASTVGPTITALRHAGVRESLTLIRRGDLVGAQLQLVHAVERQARVAGIRDVHLPCSPIAGLRAPEVRTVRYIVRFIQPKPYGVPA